MRKTKEVKSAVPVAYSLAHLFTANENLTRLGKDGNRPECVDKNFFIVRGVPREHRVSLNGNNTNVFNTSLKTDPVFANSAKTHILGDMRNLLQSLATPLEKSTPGFGEVLPALYGGSVASLFDLNLHRRKQKDFDFALIAPDASKENFIICVNRFVSKIEGMFGKGILWTRSDSNITATIDMSNVNRKFTLLEVEPKFTIQLFLRMYRSPCDLVNGADIGPGGFACINDSIISGKGHLVVIASPLAMILAVTGAILVDPRRWSNTMGVRIHKYASRFNLKIWIPSLDALNTNFCASEFIVSMPGLTITNIVGGPAIISSRYCNLSKEGYLKHRDVYVPGSDGESRVYYKEIGPYSLRSPPTPKGSPKPGGEGEGYEEHDNPVLAFRSMLKYKNVGNYRKTSPTLAEVMTEDFDLGAKHLEFGSEEQYIGFPLNPIPIERGQHPRNIRIPARSLFQIKKGS